MRRLSRLFARYAKLTHKWYQRCVGNIKATRQLPLVVLVEEANAEELRRLEAKRAAFAASTLLVTKAPLATTLQQVACAEALSPVQLAAVVQALAKCGDVTAIRVARGVGRKSLARPEFVALKSDGAAGVARIQMVELMSAANAKAGLKAGAPGVRPIALRIAGAQVKTQGEEDTSADAVAVALVAPAPAAASQQALVSVIIPTHNEAAYIRQALQSLLHQTYANLEIIVVDDASTDATTEVVAEMARRDSRIRLIVMPQNEGAYVARNEGMQHATGTFITFHDADDISRLDRIERCVRGIEGADYVYGHFARVAEGQLAPAENATIYRRGVITLFFRREKVLASAGYYDLVKGDADSEFLERLKTQGLKKKELPFILYYARLRPDSLTTAGDLASSSLLGAKIENPFRKAYVASYREFHGQAKGDTRIEKNQLDRLFYAPRAHLAGVQRRCLMAMFPQLTPGTHDLVAAHAVAVLVKNKLFPGNASLRALMRNAPSDRELVVVAVARQPALVELVLENFARQTYRNKRLLIIDSSVEGLQAHIATCSAAAHVSVEVVRMEASETLGAQLNHAIATFVPEGALIALFGGDCCYGPMYLTEQAAVATACGALVGKAPLFGYVAAHQSLHVLPKMSPSIAKASCLRGSSLVFDKAIWQAIPFDALLRSGGDVDFVKRIHERSMSVLTTSLFNMCAVRRVRDAYSWGISEAEMLDGKSDEMVAANLAEPDLLAAVSFVPYEDG